MIRTDRCGRYLAGALATEERAELGGNWLYLAVILDLYWRCAGGWAMSEPITDALSTPSSATMDSGGIRPLPISPFRDPTTWGDGLAHSSKADVQLEAGAPEPSSALDFDLLR